MTVKKKNIKKVVKKKITKHTHLWAYFGGVCQCKCGKYLQPSGKVTAKP